MAGRFSKILEFIGLVDDEPDDMDSGAQRPIPNQNYGNQSRRQSQSSSRRGDYYEDRRQATPPRPEYDARQRRNDPPRYSTRPEYDYRQNYDSRQSSPYQSHSSSGFRDASAYETERMGYERARNSQPKQPRRDPLADEFDMMDNKPTGKEQSSTRSMSVREPSRETVIYYLRQLEECRDVINDLLKNKTVLLNLEDMDERIVQRATDTLSGAAFALEATLRKASEKTYLIAPGTMQVESTRDTERRYS